MVSPGVPAATIRRSLEPEVEIGAADRGVLAEKDRLEVAVVLEEETGDVAAGPEAARREQTVEIAQRQVAPLQHDGGSRADRLLQHPLEGVKEVLDLQLVEDDFREFELLREIEGAGHFDRAAHRKSVDAEKEQPVVAAALRPEQRPPERVALVHEHAGAPGGEKLRRGTAFARIDHHILHPAGVEILRHPRRLAIGGEELTVDQKSVGGLGGGDAPQAAQSAVGVGEVRQQNEAPELRLDRGGDPLLNGGVVALGQVHRQDAEAVKPPPGTARRRGGHDEESLAAAALHAQKIFVHQQRHRLAHGDVAHFEEFPQSRIGGDRLARFEAATPDALPQDIGDLAVFRLALFPTLFQNRRPLLRLTWCSRPESNW